MAQYLLMNKASTNIKNALGDTAHTLAQRTQNNDLVMLLSAANDVSPINSFAKGSSMAQASPAYSSSKAPVQRRIISSSRSIYRSNRDSTN